MALMAGMAFAESHAKTIRMGTEGAYPPYNFLNDNGEVDGYEREIGDEMCKRAELTCEWVTNDFTQNYIPPAASAYVGLSADADITGGVIAAQTSTIQAGYVAESGATLLEFATYDETVAAVRNGEADAVFADKDALVPAVDESGGELVFVGEDVQLGGGVGMGLRESDTELKEKFNAAITSMKEDGTINAAIKKWFGEDATVFE